MDNRQTPGAVGLRRRSSSYDMSTNKKKKSGTTVVARVPRSISNMELAHPSNQEPDNIQVPNTAREAVVEGPRQPQRRKVSTKSSIIYFCPLCKQTNVAILESHFDDCLQKLSKNIALSSPPKQKPVPTFHPLNLVFSSPPPIPTFESTISEELNPLTGTPVRDAENVR